MRYALLRLSLAIVFLLGAREARAEGGMFCLYWGWSCCSGEPNDCLGECSPPNWEYQDNWILKVYAVSQYNCKVIDM